MMIASLSSSTILAFSTKIRNLINETNMGNSEGRLAQMEMVVAKPQGYKPLRVLRCSSIRSYGLFPRVLTVCFMMSLNSIHPVRALQASTIIDTTIGYDQSVQERSPTPELIARSSSYDINDLQSAKITTTGVEPPSNRIEDRPLNQPSYQAQDTQNLVPDWEMNMTWLMLAFLFCSIFPTFVFWIAPFISQCLKTIVRYVALMFTILGVCLIAIEYGRKPALKFVSQQVPEAVGKYAEASAAVLALPIYNVLVIFALLTLRELYARRAFIKAFLLNSINRIRRALAFVCPWPLTTH